MIKTARIATGKARAEGRQPSHDGEYITIYYSTDKTSDIIAEHNAGTFCLDDEGLTVDGLSAAEEEALKEEWDGIRAEAYEITHDDTGEAIKSQYAVGSEAKAEMISLGWATAQNFDGNSYFAEGA
jgi:hypothetical protein